MIQGLNKSDASVELFAVAKDLKAFYKGTMIYFYELPVEIINDFREKYLNDTIAVSELSKTISSEDEQLRQYCWCNNGGINHEADLDENLEIHGEYWDCGKRGNCQLEGIVCGNFATNKTLTKREIVFAKYLADGLLDKEIADKMGIEYTTACTFRKNIQIKTGTQNKVELVSYLFRQNLIN